MYLSDFLGTDLKDCHEVRRLQTPLSSFKARVGQFACGNMIIDTQGRLHLIDYASVHFMPSLEESELLLRVDRLRVCTRLWKRHLAPLLGIK